MIKTKEIDVVKEKNVSKNESTSVESFIQQAISRGASIETIKELMAMRKEYKAEVAQAGFVTAMSGFQSECPVIKKNKKVFNKDGKSLRYQYAPIESIVEQIKKPLAKYHLAYSFDVKNETGFIIAIVTITHSLGYSKTSEFKIPIDTEGYMTAPQKFASALTFAKRYALCNALGISTGDEDTDAVDVGKEKTAKSTKSKIIFLLKNLGKTVATKEYIQEAVLALTNLELVEVNFSEIVSRLELLVTEKNHEDTEIL